MPCTEAYKEHIMDTFNGFYPNTEKSNIDEIPEITLHNVSFQYGDQVILQDINYSFHAGGKYAVMGSD